jgi:hypothetical protein
MQLRKSHLQVKILSDNIFLYVIYFCFSYNPFVTQKNLSYSRTSTNHDANLMAGNLQSHSLILGEPIISKTKLFNTRFDRKKHVI